MICVNVSRGMYEVKAVIPSDTDNEQFRRWMAATADLMAAVGQAAEAKPTDTQDAEDEDSYF